MQESLFTVAKLEDFVPVDHPLRAIRVLVNDALTAMNAQFNAIYAQTGRDSIAPERLIRALLLQVFYSIRSYCSVPARGGDNVTVLLREHVNVSAACEIVRRLHATMQHNDERGLHGGKVRGGK